MFNRSTSALLPITVAAIRLLWSRNAETFSLRLILQTQNKV
jgi:hypothetical protein